MVGDLRKEIKMMGMNEKKEMQPVIDRTELMGDDRLVQVWRLNLDADDTLEWQEL